MAIALVAAACGGGGGSSSSTAAESSGGGEAETGALTETTKATLVLDFIPNAVHAGIYRAERSRLLQEENIDLNVIEPTSTADTLKLIDAGKADFGIADGIDFADPDRGRARREGHHGPASSGLPAA